MLIFPMKQMGHNRPSLSREKSLNSMTEAVKVGNVRRLVVWLRTETPDAVPATRKAAVMRSALEADIFLIPDDMFAYDRRQAALTTGRFQRILRDVFGNQVF